MCAGSAISPLTSTAAATGGSGTFTYQWEASPDNTTWTAIGGATGETYAPGALGATTYFRRQVHSGPCATAPTNTVTITVVPTLVAGTIAADQALCSGATPAALTSTAPATGGSGSTTYQWESSGDNTTFTAITGATGPTYAPGALTATTYYRRRAGTGSGCAPVTSNVVTITVAPALLAGSIGSDQTLCAGTAPAPLSSTGAASGGTGTFTYQWESSPDNATFTAISGATSADYAPGGSHGYHLLPPPRDLRGLWPGVFGYRYPHATAGAERGHHRRRPDCLCGLFPRAAQQHGRGRRGHRHLQLPVGGLTG